MDAGGDIMNAIDHGGRIYEYAEKHLVDWTEIEDFSANINPLGPPQKVLDVLSESLQQIQHYPDRRHVMVKRVLSMRLSLAEDQILCGNGATEVIDLLIETLRPSRLAILTPAFQGYEQVARRWGIPLLKISMIIEDSLVFPMEKLLADLRPGDGLIINNPHNPLGFALKAEELLPLLELLETREVYMIIDESFMDFLPDQTLWSMIPSIKNHRFLYVVRSATKMYAIPGLRFGYMVGDANLVALIETKRDGWSVNQLAQTAASIAYQDKAFDERTWRFLDIEKHWISQTWGKHPSVEVLPFHANFFLVRFSKERIATQLLEMLGNKRVYLRGMNGFEPLDNRYLRVAIKHHEQNVKLWNLVEAFLCGSLST